uniref:Uncharacterized protein n=1 Tax=Ascaris lumbricoides TaxID=6252 RepID=A0A0M3IDW2_ASCLU
MLAIQAPDLRQLTMSADPNETRAFSELAPPGVWRLPKAAGLKSIVVTSHEFGRLQTRKLRAYHSTECFIASIFVTNRI